MAPFSYVFFTSFPVFYLHSLISISQLPARWRNREPNARSGSAIRADFLQIYSMISTSFTSFMVSAAPHWNLNWQLSGRVGFASLMAS